ncbi:Ubiquitin-like protein 1 [Mucor velutinosus]|uniref:Ubiquitin-like protein 1 n=1 Tax=Mucor velutinosus TaxID=708070 RepID=A0AAN7I487_9FUNG|nr:Ubiquitin-like protein 1 [Mucor velutinosus]
MSNGDFLGGDVDLLITRHIPQDDVHAMVAYGPTPIYNELKTDKFRRVLLKNLFEKFTYEKKIQRVRGYDDCIGALLAAPIDTRPYNFLRLAVYDKELLPIRDAILAEHPLPPVTEKNPVDLLRKIITNLDDLHLMKLLLSMTKSVSGSNKLLIISGDEDRGKTEYTDSMETRCSDEDVCKHSNSCLKLKANKRSWMIESAASGNPELLISGTTIGSTKRQQDLGSSNDYQNEKSTNEKPGGTQDLQHDQSQQQQDTPAHDQNNDANQTNENGATKTNDAPSAHAEETNKGSSKDASSNENNQGQGVNDQSDEKSTNHSDDAQTTRDQSSQDQPTEEHAHDKPTQDQATEAQTTETSMQDEHTQDKPTPTQTESDKPTSAESNSTAMEDRQTRTQDHGATTDAAATPSSDDHVHNEKPTETDRSGTATVGNTVTTNEHHSTIEKPTETAAESTAETSKQEPTYTTDSQPPATVTSTEKVEEPTLSEVTSETEATFSTERKPTPTVTTKEWESTSSTEPTPTVTATSEWEPTATDTTTEHELTTISETVDETTSSLSKPAATTEESQTTDHETYTTDEESLSSSSEFDNSHLSSYLSSIIYTDSTAANQQQTASNAITTDMATAVNDVPTTDAASAPAAAATSNSLEAIANIVSQTDTMASTSSAEEQTTSAATEAAAAAETSLDTTPTKSSGSIYYPSSTRSFSVTSSTATPMLVLGATECVDDPHAVEGKCIYEYFCNAATHSCVFLLEDNSACYEDFQCASTYCTDHICVAAPESKQSGQGGKIAGSVIGSVAGAAVLLFGLIRWRKRSQIINRRMNRFRSNHNNEKPAFYDATTTILPATANANNEYHSTDQGNARLSKYNFLANMLNSEPPVTAPPQQQPHYALNADHFTIPVAATERGAAALAKQSDYNPFRPAMTESSDPWTQEDYQSLKKPENKTVYSYI